MTYAHRFEEHRNPAAAYCDGKHSYPTWEAADRVIRRKTGVQRIRGARIGSFSVYACPRCGGFHIAGAK